jgi:hypothetical protein
MIDGEFLYSKLMTEINRKNKGNKSKNKGNRSKLYYFEITKRKKYNTIHSNVINKLKMKLFNNAKFILRFYFYI